MCSPGVLVPPSSSTVAQGRRRIENYGSKFLVPTTTSPLGVRPVHMEEEEEEEMGEEIRVAGNDGGPCAVGHLHHCTGITWESREGKKAQPGFPFSSFSKMKEDDQKPIAPWLHLHVAG
ncbi:hypothetical protein B296_00034544 [Ensete ventricosum]|uniref:Uncharacterized protein n=1 Tax=Ensete ventricosum TaxID=4639 RepID=A0A426YJQ4_ENSVE|nr:hypothetical protein B296_00034544 [Ensete ventricosum]